MGMGAPLNIDVKMVLLCPYNRSVLFMLVLKEHLPNSACIRLHAWLVCTCKKPRREG